MSKVAETIPVAAKAAKSNKPFFDKKGDSLFSASAEKAAPFFTSAAAAPALQAKLTVGQPGDKYEKEADTVADKVVQQMGEPGNVQAKAIDGYTKVIQTKCGDCEKEDALQKKEEEHTGEQLTEPAPQMAMPVLPEPVQPADNNRQQQPATQSFQHGFIQPGRKIVRPEENPEKEKINMPVQAKLTIGEPDDPHEKEADAVADQVVQKLGNAGMVQAKPAASIAPVMPIIQSRANITEQENEQKKEEDKTEELATDLQQKTMGAGLPEPPPDDMGENTGDARNGVQLKCNACVPEEREALVQTKPVFENDQEPLVQRSCRECEEGDRIFLKSFGMLQLVADGAGDGSRTAVLAAAKTKLGKIEAKHNDGGGRRIGADHLLEIFHLAAPGVWDDSIVQNAGAPLPSWCGIFAVWAHKKAGKDIGNWQMGKGVSAFGTLQPTNNPLPGDIGYIDKPYQHHCIVVSADGDSISSIDGNSGLFSEVKENTRPRTAFTGFFTAFNGSDTVQRKAAGGVQKKDNNGFAAEAGSSIETRLSASKGSGSTLPQHVQASMGEAIGADFSGVKIHTGSNAAAMSKDLNAQAFTHGSDIYFNSGKYDPETSGGQHLLAHELTHTVQQGAAVHKKDVPAVQKDGGDDPIQLAVGKVYDALDGWTDSDDSYLIWNQFDSTSKETTDLIIKGVASKSNDSIDATMEWLNDDMVTSDWNNLFTHFKTVNAYRTDHLIASLVYSYLSGYTSSSNSNSILGIYTGGTPVTGDMLGRSLVQLETVTENNRNDTAAYLFGDMSSPDANKLMQHFFNSGDVAAAGYAAYWTAAKIRDLIAGFTSMADSTAIVNNFERTPAAMRNVVLFELEKISQEKWNQTAAQALMEDMWQSDYERLRELMPGLLPVYNIEKNFLEWGWEVLKVGFDLLSSLVEYVVCGLIGIIWGIITVVIDIVVAVVDLGVAVVDLLGMIVYFVTGGQFCKENKDRVYGFFKAMGMLWDAPGDAIAAMWDELTMESSLIEGPFSACKKAVFWVSRIINLFVNILLIFAAGYGAVKTALKGIEAVIGLARAGELVSALKTLPGKLWSAIKKLPPATAKAILSGASKVVRLLKNPLEIIGVIKNTITIIRLTAEDEGYFKFVRKQLGEVIEGESKFWKERREFWKQSADSIESGVSNTEKKLVIAVDTTASDAAKAEALITDAEAEAKASKAKCDELMDDVNGKKTGEEAKKPIPGSPESEKLALEWEKGLNPETRDMLDKDAGMRRFWHEMDPEVRRALTYCNTPCIPTTVSSQNLSTIQELMQRLKIPSENLRFREYLHIYRNSNEELAKALRALTGLNDVKDLDTFLDNELIKFMQKVYGVTVRRAADGLWEYVRANGEIIKEFEMGSHSFLTGNRGTNSFFQSHHGIQNAWAKQRFNGLGVYDEEKAKTLLLRTINLEGGKRGTPHGLIGDLQNNRRATIATRTFAEERAALVSDLGVIGAPPAVSTPYLAQVDAYFGEIYNILKTRLGDAELKAIFGTWHP